MEFALALPLVLGVGLYGGRDRQSGADEPSPEPGRDQPVGQCLARRLNNNLSNQQLREVDINDVLIAARLQARPGT